MKRTTTAMIVGVAMSGLLSGTAARLQAAPASSGAPLSADKAGQQLADTPAEKHDCKGQNTCKGKGGCKSGDNGCKGKNTCKGKGGCSTNKPS